MTKGRGNVRSQPPPRSRSTPVENHDFFAINIVYMMTGRKDQNIIPLYLPPTTTIKSFLIAMIEGACVKCLFFFFFLRFGLCYRDVDKFMAKLDNRYTTQLLKFRGKTDRGCVRRT